MNNVLLFISFIVWKNKIFSHVKNPGDRNLGLVYIELGLVV